MWKNEDVSFSSFFSVILRDEFELKYQRVSPRHREVVLFPEISKKKKNTRAN